MKNSDELNKKIGKRLRECRLANGMTQKEFSEASHYSIQQICYIENGKRQMSAEAAQIFSTVLGVRSDYLLAKDDSKTDVIYLEKQIKNMFAPAERQRTLLNLLNDYIILMGASISYKFKDIDDIFPSYSEEISVGNIFIPIWKNKANDPIILESIYISYKDTNYKFTVPEYYAFLENINDYISFKITNIKKENDHKESHKGYYDGCIMGYNGDYGFLEEEYGITSDHVCAIGKILHHKETPDN